MSSDPYSDDCVELVRTILDGIGDTVLWGKDGELRSSDAFYERVACSLIELVTLYPERAKETVQAVLLMMESLPECRLLTLLNSSDGFDEWRNAHVRRREILRDLEPPK